MKVFINVLFAALFGISATSYGQPNKGTQLKKEFLTTVDLFSKKIAQQKNPQILDARSEEEFEQTHIKDAINVDPSVKNFEQQFTKLNKESPVFIYSIQSGRSSGVGQLLKQQGFKEIYVLSPGIASWVGSGKAVVAPAKHKNRLALLDFKKLLSAEDLILVDYGSRYCPPCKKVIPVLDSLTNRPGNKVKTFVLEIDANPEIIKEYQITSLPTVILYRKGKAVWKKSGIPSLAEIDNAVATISKTAFGSSSRTKVTKATICTQSNLPARFGFRNHSPSLGK
jgi:rhodanese-related sulfurtransferase